MFVLQVWAKIGKHLPPTFSDVRWENIEKWVLQSKRSFFFNPGHSPLVAMETMERKNMQFFVSFGKDFGERNK